MIVASLNKGSATPYLADKLIMMSLIRGVASGQPNFGAAQLKIGHFAPSFIYDSTPFLQNPGYATVQSLLASISGRLKTLIFQWATIEAREWLHLPLFRTLLLLLEVRKLLKLLGVAHLEGRLKSRSYGV